MARLRTLIGVLGALAIAACGGGAAGDGASAHEPSPWGAQDDTGRDRPSGPAPITLDGGWDSGGPSADYPATHPAMPVVMNAGGRVLKAPRVVPVTFDGDPYRATLEDFVKRIGDTSFWTATTKEYGVGPLVAAAPVRASDIVGAVVDDHAIQAWLRSKLLDPAAPLGPADESSVYLLFYPPGVQINLEGYASCDVFGAYHSEVAVGEQHVAYAVIPRCASFADVHGFDVTTVAASHELVEAATDPLPYTDPAYVQPDDDHAVWGAFTGGEVGDMCTYNQGAFYKPADFPFMVQRSWSNAAAAAGHDPCVPALPGETYFNTAAELPDKVSLLGQPTKGLRIAVHEKANVDLALYSDGPTDEPWEVAAQDLSELAGGPPVLSFSFARKSGQNGERLQMTIEVLAIDPAYGGEGFVVMSQRHGQTSYFYGFVQN